MTVVTIEDLSSSGEGVGTLDGKKVFVEGALPKERVEIAITSSKRQYAKAKLLKIIESSADRITPICPLFGTCGGCQIMHLSYEMQILWKQKRVCDALSRIGGFTVKVAPCVPSPDQLGYRNKIHLHKGGFYKRHSHEIVPIDRCYIHNPVGEKVLSRGREADEAIIKSSLSSKEVLLVLDGKASCESITETLADLHFKIGPNDFFQVNPKQAVRLYEKAVQCSELDGQTRVLDAYCGVGCLSLFAAKQACSVEGVESGKGAIKRAKENAGLNGIDNVSFICAQVEHYMSTLEDFDVIFLNPPRGGVDSAVIQALIKRPPKKLIYISCDPATLSRDLKHLSAVFHIEEVFPFDLFPQTVHVETLVSLSRKI